MKDSTSEGTSALERQLLQHLELFTAFARRRVGDPDLAADAVQDSLLKAVKAAPQLRAGENVIAWFYRILRRTIIDLYRRRATNRQAMERFEHELATTPEADADANKVTCACVENLLPTLKPEYAELIQRLDLEQQSLADMAETLGLSANNLRVRHHRARRQLRERLEMTCQMCARHGCLDCTCE